MKFRDLLFMAGAASAGLLIYGALVEANRLVLERRRLRLKGWPKRLDGFKLAVLADLHIRDQHSVELTKRAVEMALDESPDMIALPGDIIGYWKPETPWLVGEALKDLILMNGDVVASPGNREYWGGSSAILEPVLEELGIKFLRNDVWRHGGIVWAGIDSVNAGLADPFSTMENAIARQDTDIAEESSRPSRRSRQHGQDARAALPRIPIDPIIAIWHEPDKVKWLPHGAALMVSGHTHGGQFRTPWGWPPMTTENGRLYLDGFFPEAPTPLYVSRGIGTTGPPSRLFCAPEVSLLVLESAE